MATDASLEVAAGRLIDVGPTRLHVRELGAGPPLVLVHSAGLGSTGLSRSSPCVDALAAHHRVIAPDLPGFGSSPDYGPAFPPDPAGWVDVLTWLLDALELPTASFLAAAHASVPVLCLAAERPDRVRRLVLVGPPGAIVSARPTTGIRSLRQLGASPTAAAVSDYLATLVNDPAQITARIVQERVAAVRAQLARRAPREPIRAADDTWAERLPVLLPRVTAPTLLIHGMQDRHVDPAQSLVYAKHLPHADVVLFGGAGSWVELERAADFNDTVVAFLADADSTASAPRRAMQTGEG